MTRDVTEANTDAILNVLSHSIAAYDNNINPLSAQYKDVKVVVVTSITIIQDDNVEIFAKFGVVIECSIVLSLIMDLTSSNKSQNKTKSIIIQLS